MKKVIIAVVSAALALGVEAATSLTIHQTATITYGYDLAHAEKFTGNIYFVVLQNSDGYQTKQEALKKAYESGKLTPNSSFDTIKNIVSPNNANPVGVLKVTDGKFSDTSINWTSDSFKWFTYFMIEESMPGALDNGKGFLVMQPGQSSISSQNNFSGNFTAVAGNNAYPEAYPIPEPTSGLLMLLGMAGLALKRKRA